MGRVHTAALLVSAAAAMSGQADGSAFAEILLNGQSELAFADVIDDPIVDVSLWLDRSGDTNGFFSSFTGWSNFKGEFVSDAGAWIIPIEDASQTNGDAGFPDNWIGRRAPSQLGFPGGSGGGFRTFSTGSQEYFVADGGQRLSASSGSIEGGQTSDALGGFQQATEPRIEVFRAELDLSGIATQNVEVAFTPGLLQIFIESGFGNANIERSVFFTTEFRSGLIIVPAPGAIGLFGLAGLGLRRRRS